MADGHTTLRPIAFSGPMVRALLGGRKTQTRRILTKRQMRRKVSDFDPENVAHRREALNDPPYGGAGDKLWVKETLIRGPEISVGGFWINFEADGLPTAGDHVWPWVRKIQPAMFCPAWASRIALEITGVRLERLQEISTADVWAEGFSARDEMAALWDKVNSERCPWVSNPWIWALDFRRIG